eukprot:9113489-Lingulodinium_polyedra.AAC.1
MARRQAQRMIVEHAVVVFRHHLLSTPLQVADGLCTANLVDGTVLDDVVDDDTVVDGQSYVGRDCEDVLCVAMD